MNTRRVSKRLRKVLGETPSPRLLKKPKVAEGNETFDYKDEVLSVLSCNQGDTEVSCHGVGPRQSEASERVRSDSPDPLSDEQPSDEDDDAYEAKRLQNIKDNAAFLSQLGIFKDKENLRMKKKTNQTKTTTVKPVKKKSSITMVTRRASMRLQRIDPDGVPLPPPELPAPPEDEFARKPAGPLKASEYIEDHPPGADVEAFMSHLHMLSRLHTKVKVKQQIADTRSYVKSLSKMHVAEENVMKLVPKRIFSIVIHPTRQLPLVAVGDKMGRLGLWDVSQGEKGVFNFEPHSRPIPHLELPKENPGKIYSSSYDGTLRCLDVEKGVFEEVYITDEEEDIRLNGFSFLSPDTLVVGQSDGRLGVVDLRANTYKAEHMYPAHTRLIKSTSVHPVHSQYFVSSSNDCCVLLWDQRMMKTDKPRPLDRLQHGKGVDSAYFSPITGNYLVSTSLDNTVRVFDSSEVSTDIKEKKSVRHDNYTGRWLSNFRSVWHPSREDLFIVGSMNRPRQIEMFSVDGSLVKTFSGENFGCVCSLNAFHPTEDILVGANSSGRVYVFM